jgi:hypothetical protein
MNTCWKRADAAHGGNESSVLSVSDVWYINGLYAQSSTSYSNSKTVNSGKCIAYKENQFIAIYLQDKSGKFMERIHIGKNESHRPVVSTSS